MLRRLLSLWGLFLKLLIRRKLMWGVVALLAVMMLINYFVIREMQESERLGDTTEIAVGRATARLESYAGAIRGYGIAFVLLSSALLAPSSRKDGTTQFALSLAVSRLELAVAQFAALATLVSAAVAVVHVGYAVTAWRLQAMSAAEIALAWLWLLMPLLLLSVAVFALSLRWSAIATYVVFLAVPYLALPLVEAGAAEHSWAPYVPVLVTRMVDNAQWLFPQTYELVFWPRLWPHAGLEGPPLPDWTWLIVHTGLATAFWVGLGVWAYLRHDFGSRIPTK